MHSLFTTAGCSLLCLLLPYLLLPATASNPSEPSSEPTDGPSDSPDDQPAAEEGREKSLGEELILAIRADDLPAVEALLKAHPHVSLIGGDDDLGYTAVIYNRLDILKALHAHGGLVDIHETTNFGPGSADGLVMLDNAVMYGHVEMVKWLLEKGVEGDVFVCEDTCIISTPLHRAAGMGHRAMVELLLRWGWRVGERDGAGKTPLRVLAEGGGLKARALVTSMLISGASMWNVKNPPPSPTETYDPKGTAEALIAAGADWAGKEDGIWGRFPPHTYTMQYHANPGTLQLLSTTCSSPDRVAIKESSRRSSKRRVRILPKQGRRGWSCELQSDTQLPR